MTNDIQTVQNEIYNCFPMLRGFFLRKTRNMADAEDAAMNGIIKAIENADKYNGQSKVSTWVCTIAYRCWLDSLRKGSKKKTVYTGNTVFLENIGGSYEMKENENTIESSVFWNLIESIVNPKQYEALHLHYAQGMKYKDIAAQLDCPIGTVMSRINGGKKKLANSTLISR